MAVEHITSRKNAIIQRLRALAADGALRRAEGEYLCDGHKLLAEALDKGAELRSVLWKEKPGDAALPANVRQYTAPAELFDYASPMKNSPGPLFTLALPAEPEGVFNRAILLENVQDPGNVGTVIRTAAAMGVDTVLLCGACADVYSPKTARATMGAIFREKILHCTPDEARALAVPVVEAAHFSPDRQPPARRGQLGQHRTRQGNVQPVRRPGETAGQQGKAVIVHAAAAVAEDAGSVHHAAELGGVVLPCQGATLLHLPARAGIRKVCASHGGYAMHEAGVPLSRG